MIYIANGTDVNAAWTDVIAVSKDGTNWEQINKENLSVKPRFIQQNTDSPIVNRPTQTLISLVYENKRDVAVSFECQDVSSGAGVGQHTTWQAGTQAALQVAAAEISGWI